MGWKPKRTFAETEAILTAPGSMHETVECEIRGRRQKVYKHLWPSMRAFWLDSVRRYGKRTYIVFEDQRITYEETHIQAVRLATALKRAYGVSKGDRVAIVSRNCIEYMYAFWACHMLGAVAVLVNAWLPVKPLSYCISHTQCRVVICDPERSAVIQPVVDDLAASSVAGFLVFGDTVDVNAQWAGMQSYSSMVQRFSKEIDEAILADGHDYLDVDVQPEDTCAVMFTSGTTGMPKGVLSTQRQYLTNVLNVLVGSRRAALRRGEDITSSLTCNLPQKGALVAVPLFHVTGTTSYSMMATMTGMKIVLMRKWDPVEGEGSHHFARPSLTIPQVHGMVISPCRATHRLMWSSYSLIRGENVQVAGGVPAMVSDLLHSPLAGHPIECLLFGGAPAPESLVERVQESFPGSSMSTAYGLTETNSIAVSIAGEDYVARPTTVGRPSPVNEIRIVAPCSAASTSLPLGEAGEVLIRGPNIMQEYYGDSEATARVLTRDGWLRTGDIGYLDNEGFLYIKDRIKDIIIRGGENVDSVAVENALYNDPRVLQAACVGVPDARLGELVTAVVHVRAGQGVTDAALLARCRTSLPRFAVPVMIVVQYSPLEMTPSGKIVKHGLRKFMQEKWKRERESIATNTCARL
ncbi:acetyl-CoA synthetase-like protein [Schizophyllum commune Tattone D]|nr:acetyl-CoA synthetase-like protein [Schizophyllum commune Tattone D]